MSLTRGEIRALRPPRRPVDPGRALGTELEVEREPDGGLLPTVTVFLAGAECPFSCVFCDLWRYTLEGPTPSGALPKQLAESLAELPDGHLQGRIKLYNASNFFDRRAVPTEDLPQLAELVKPFQRVVVECHALLVGPSCHDFAQRLGGRLEVALGLECCHPETLARLEKKMTLADFDRAADRLRLWGIPWRAFVLLGVPFLSADEADRWAERSVAYAIGRGAERVALIPVREGNGALEEIAERGEWQRPTLHRIEEVFDRAAVAFPGRVSLDLWELERFSGCSRCLPQRRARLERMQLDATLAPRVACASCRSANTNGSPSV